MVVPRAMRDAALHTEPEDLLAETRWVRELPRRMAAGADGDDVDQATWLAALRGKRRAGVPACEAVWATIQQFGLVTRTRGGVPVPAVEEEDIS